MRVRRKAAALLGAALLVGSFAAVATADDGIRVSKSMSHEGSLDENKLPENEHAFIKMMDFYVPMQSANGTTEFEAPAGTYVPDGTPGTPPNPTGYYDIDGNLVETRTAAKPLVGVYINGEVEHVDVADPLAEYGVGFVGHGKRDAYAAISLDDGMTWKNTNLSESADEASSDVLRPDIGLFSDTDYEYPGDVVNIFHAVAGDSVVVAWPSRYCSGGQPNYSLDAYDKDTGEAAPDAMARRLAIADYLGIDLYTASADDLYLIDMFRVAGQQGSVDYTEDKWEQNHIVGEVPFNCLWTARGKLVNGDDPRTTEVVESSFMRWFKPERLTSGRRDVNRVEVKGVEGAGFAITWQEDPEGLRPGQGEGPGAGWSGAVANHQTDIWYSYVDWETFDVVQDPTIPAESVDPYPGTVPMVFEDYELEAANLETDTTQKPKPFVPFAMPMPITDNAKCNVENPAPYCWGSALQGDITLPDGTSVTPTEPMDEQLDISLDPALYGMRDMCAATVEIPTGHTGTPKLVCVPEYAAANADGQLQGVPLVGNTAATRARLGLFADDDGGAFVVVQLEESKGLGRATYEPAPYSGDTQPDAPTGLPSDTECTEPAPDHGTHSDTYDCIPFDIGKNQWYHSFRMSLPAPVAADAEAVTAADDPVDGLLANVAFHGHLLNQPEIDWTTGDFVWSDPSTEGDYPGLDTGEVLGYDEYGFTIHNTEIARRGSLLAQSIAAAEGSESGLLALPTWKQGQMNQGGPADVMSRRIDLDNQADDGNPYAFRNMECELWLYADEGTENPYYPGGLCLDPAINMSSTIPDTSIDSATGEDNTVELPIIGDDGSSTVNPFLRGLVQGEGDTTKVLTWHQAPVDVGLVDSTDGFTPVTADPDGNTFDDQSWYNPYEVAKGHRGFLDGDFVMMLYAWSPNWRLNAVGHDRYELYVRRSFDGADTWTTTPTDYEGDGTVTCETYRTADAQQQGDSTEPRACYEYGAGGFEQARNVTQHKSMRTTTLDPRYAKTAPTITDDPFGSGYALTEEDVHDPSRYFIVFETGDNTTTDEGEPEPLDLFYGRAVNYGDDYQVWAEEDDLSVCYPNDLHDVVDDRLTVPEGSGFCNEFDQVEQGKPGLEASEASLAANPGGEFLYAAWSQIMTDDGSAAEAQAEADAALAAAVEAQAAADAAQLAADEAQAAADKADLKADRAEERAERAQTLADRAQRRAERLAERAEELGTPRSQIRANRAQAAAEELQQVADRFEAKAIRLRTAADEAQAAADEAQAEADRLQVLADDALAEAERLQALADEIAGEIGDSDAMVRRIWWIDDYISSNPDLVWTLPGTNKTTETE